MEDWRTGFRKQLKETGWLRPQPESDLIKWSFVAGGMAAFVVGR